MRRLDEIRNMLTVAEQHENNNDLGLCSYTAGVVDALAWVLSSTDQPPNLLRRMESAKKDK